MKLHHIGIVCKENQIDKFYFKPKKKFTYYDKVQNNKLIIEFNKDNNLWMEFVVPQNKNSTVYNYLVKHGPGVHHFGYITKKINEKKKLLSKRKDFFYINSYTTNVPCFGGLIKTMFFYNNNFLIELLENVDKK